MQKSFLNSQALQDFFSHPKQKNFAYVKLFLLCKGIHKASKAGGMLHRCVCVCMWLCMHTHACELLQCIQPWYKVHAYKYDAREVCISENSEYYAWISVCGFCISEWKVIIMYRRKWIWKNQCLQISTECDCERLERPNLHIDLMCSRQGYAKSAGKSSLFQQSLCWNYSSIWVERSLLKGKGILGKIGWQQPRNVWNLPERYW